MTRLRRCLDVATTLAWVPVLVGGGLVVGAVAGLGAGLGLARDLVYELRHPREPLGAYDG